MQKFIIAIAIIIAGLTAYGGYQVYQSRVQAERAQRTPITFGVIMPLTGDTALYGKSTLKAIELAVKEVNASGGINGRQVNLVTEDGQCDADPAEQAAKKLVDQGIKVIIGGACSGETLAAAKVTEPARVILISPSASSPSVSEAGDFVFRTYPSDSLSGRIAARYASEQLRAKRAAVIVEDTPYAQGLREVFKTAFAQRGGAIALDLVFPTENPDLAGQAAQAAAADPDVVYIVPQSPNFGVDLVKALRAQAPGKPILTAEVLLDRSLIKDNAAALEGVVGIEPAADYMNNPKAKAFKEAHFAAYGEIPPGPFAAAAYDAVQLLREAIAAYGLDTAAIRDWLYGVTSRDTLLGKMTIDGKGDPLLPEHVWKIQGGQVVDQGDFTP